MFIKSIASITISTTNQKITLDNNYLDIVYENCDRLKQLAA